MLNDLFGFLIEIQGVWPTDLFVKKIIEFFDFGQRNFSTTFFMNNA